MANIHFIWSGNPETAKYKNAALTTPNQFATSKGENEVWYWHWGRGFPLGELSEDITPKDFNELLAEAEEESRFKGVTEIVNNLIEYHAHSAVKDLLSFLVLYQYGGYYFDTTVQVADKDVIKLETAFDDRDEVAIALRPGEVAFKAQQFTAKYAMILASNLSKGHAVKNVDMWALYSPAQHDVVRKMAKYYILAARNAGFHKFPAKVKTGFKIDDKAATVHDLMTNDEMRKPLIAGMVIGAALNAFLRLEYPYVEHGWQMEEQTNPISDKKWSIDLPLRLKIDNLFIYKQHMALWRNLDELLENVRQVVEEDDD